MLIRYRTAYWLLLITGASLLAMASCGGSGEPPKPLPQSPSPTPFVIETSGAPAGTPTPTPVPELERDVAIEFVLGHRAIATDWDSYHAAFDAWREGLTACDPSSVETALNRFAGGFVELAEAARALPRDQILRDLADGVVVAVETDAEALRQLRDGWQPGDTALFAQVDAARASASLLRNETRDQLSDLAADSTASVRSTVRAFSAALKSVNTDWDTFHGRFDAFRRGESQDPAITVPTSVSELVDEFRQIALAVRDLPQSSVTQRVSRVMSEAVDTEDLALRRLRTAVEGGGGEDPEDPFATFEAQLVRVNTLRAQAVQEMPSAIDAASQGSRDAVTLFGDAFDALMERWDVLHADYDEWRVDEGGCDRQAAVEALGEFVLQIGEIADVVRALPRAVFLRPLGELYVEAAEQAQEAFKGLRNGWQPFDLSVYATLESERSEVGRLRRQVDAGIQDLLARYDISIRDLEDLEQ